MKKILLLIAAIVLMLPSTILSQEIVDISITDMSNETLRNKMSKSATALISEINKSYFSNNRPSLSNINMTNQARQDVLQIWDNSTFRCIETELYLRCLNTSSGFQVRNIPIIVKEGNENQDLVINFSSTGAISNIYFAIENHRYQAVMKSTNSVTDMRRRQMILNFIENFRTAYNRKDLPLIKDMYSDQALIITGSVYQTVDTEFGGLPVEKVRYNKQSKTQYISKLQSVFANNKYINIMFDNIKVAQHPANNDIYGVTLKQAWRTSNYSDDGWLFLVIHFENDSKMYVDVRTWQPYMLNGEILPDTEIFSLGDFTF
ncbi:MAG: nuclear transport factor 2 family protein [Rikenellaceae bacterium]